MGFEIKVFGYDPFDIMCSDCEVHEIWWWEGVTVDDLRRTHEEHMEMDAATPAWAIEDMKAQGEWEPTPLDFEEWLRKAIKDEYVRVAAA